MDFYLKRPSFFYSTDEVNFCGMFFLIKQTYDELKIFISLQPLKIVLIKKKVRY